MNAAETIANTLVSTDLAEARGDFSHLSVDQRATLDRALIKLHEGDVTGEDAIASILNRTVRMPLYRWDDAQHAFGVLARKAAARNLPVPTIEEVSREIIGEGVNAETWLTARILGAAPVLNGWRCVATLTAVHEHNEAGERIPGTERIITHVADGESFDDAGASMRCDHCNYNRNRHLVFVLRHEDGREMLVGSTCLNDYLGTDALGAWFVWSRLHEIAKTVGGWTSWDIADHAAWLADHPTAITRGAATNHAPIPVARFLAACAAEVRVCGYVTKRQAWDNMNADGATGPTQATGSKVWLAYQTAEHVAPLPEDYARAEEIVAWIGTLDRDEYAYNARRGEYDPTYHANLARALDNSDTGVHSHDANMLASSVTAYARELERRQRDAAWTNEWVPGKIDDAVVLSLTVRRSLGWALACADSAGRQVLVRKQQYSDGARVQIGDMIRVSGSIGGLNEYRGTKQTFISRPTVFRLHDELSSPIRKKARAMFERNGEPVPSWAEAKTRSRKK